MKNKYIYLYIFLEIYKIIGFIIVIIYPFAFDFSSFCLFYITGHIKREITQRYGRNTRLNYGDSAFDGFMLRVVYTTNIVVSK